MYRYAVLDPRPSGADHNNEILRDPTTVLGIEVTVPSLAARCGLGNIDPQHTGGDAGTAAIEVALTYPLPPAGTTLVTVRRDADSIGAMAVLTSRFLNREVLRSKVRNLLGRRGLVTPEGEVRIKLTSPGWGHMHDVRATLGLNDIGLSTRDGDPETALANGEWVQVTHCAEIRERVQMIATADKERSGPWPGPRLIRTWEDLVGPCAIASAVAQDHTMSVEDSVRSVCAWLSYGDADRVDDEWERHRRAVATEARKAFSGSRCTVQNGVAVVESNHRGATAIGYQSAPVVIATNPRFSWAGGPPHRKHTIARWNSTQRMDWEGLLEQLSAREPGWGGSSIIIGSPQGVDSRLTTEEVVAVVHDHLRRTK